MISPTHSLNYPQTISEKIEEIKQLQAEQRKLRAKERQAKKGLGNQRKLRPNALKKQEQLLLTK